MQSMSARLESLSTAHRMPRDQIKFCAPKFEINERTKIEIEIAMAQF